MSHLDGRVVLITGAGRGIGRAEALLFAAEGAKVVVNDPGIEPDGTGPDDSVAAAVADEITRNGGHAIANTDSVADWDGARRMVDAAVDAFGDLHVVVNNATLHRLRALVRMTEQEFDDVLDVKLKGTFAVSRWAATHWKQRYEAGDRIDRAIVNTSSGSGLLNPGPAAGNYAAANAGVAALTIVHALELRRYGVRVNCISPSMARTRLTRDIAGTGLDQAPTDGSHDPGDPIHQAVLAAALGTPNCRLTGQVLSARGSSVALNHGWTVGQRLQQTDRTWQVAELRDALDELDWTDPLERLAATITGALGTAGGAQLQQLVDAILDDDQLPFR